MSLNFLNLSKAAKPAAPAAPVAAPPVFLSAKAIQSTAIQDVPPPPNTLKITAEMAASFLEAAGGSAAKQEMDRIVGLEVCQPMTPEECEATSAQFIRAEPFAQGFRLRRSQAEGVVNYLAYGGMFGQIGVGDGKTLLSLLICHCALRNGRKPLLSIPSHVFQQLWNTDIRFARMKSIFDSPVLTIAKKTRKERYYTVTSGKRAIYITTHSLLSQPDCHEWLNMLAPDCIVIDEAHNFANARAARTRRLTQAMGAMLDDAVETKKRDVQVVALSGTMTKRSVLDYHHLAKVCLKANCPLPKQASLAEEWGLVIDSGADVDVARKAGPLTPLVRWAKSNFPDHLHLLSEDVAGFRRAFRLRKDSAPGVVTADDTVLGASLHIANRPFTGDETYPHFKDLLLKIKEVDEVWLAPNGDEIEFAIHKHKWLRELSAGFYNQLVWPDPEKVAKSKNIPYLEAEQLVEDAKIAHEARNVLAKEVRTWLSENAHDGMDTPLLLMRSMAQHGSEHVTDDLYEAWKSWHLLKSDNHPEREEKPVRVCDYKVQLAVTWAKEQLAIHKRGGVIWSYHTEINRWIFEEIEKAGLPAMFCPASSSVDKILADPEKHADLKQKILCASISSHGEGKNLQFMESMFIAQWDPSAKRMEQLLGRLHRPGQEAEEVHVTTCNSITWDDENAASCIIDSLYVHQTSGRQKLIYCSWEPLPRMYPPEALRQRGFDNVLLDDAGRRALAERFGV